MEKMDEIKVLIISNDKEKIEHVENLLYSTKKIAANISIANKLNEAEKKIKKNQFDYVLIDPFYQINLNEISNHIHKLSPITKLILLLNDKISNIKQENYIHGSVNLSNKNQDEIVNQFIQLLTIKNQDKIINSIDNKYYHELIESSPFGIILLRDTYISYANKKAKTILTSDDLTEKEITGFLYPNYQTYYHKWIEKIKNNEQESSEIEVVMFSQNKPINILLTANCSNFKNDSILQIYLKDITQSKQYEIANQKLLDENQENDINYIINYLNNTINSCSSPNHHILVTFLTIDNINITQDLLGYKAYTTFINAIEDRIKQITNHHDSLFKISNANYILITKDVENLNSISYLPNKILKFINSPIKISNNEIIPKITCGISIYPEHGNNANKLIKAAQLAHYYAKNQKKKFFSILPSTVSNLIYEKSELLHGLKNAIKNNEFVLHYQPIFNVKKNKIVGLESLLRWKKSNNSILYPNDFMTIAEESGITYEIGEWVINQAINKAIEISKNKSYQYSIPISINLSSHEIYYQTLLSSIIENKINENQLSPKLLEFEITSNTISFEPYTETLKKLNDLGINVSIDNFGSSYFSIQDILKYYFNAIKIDKKLINGIPDNVESKMIITSLIAIATKLHINVVAKGIENKDQLTFLQENNCYIQQGNYLCPPLEESELNNFITIYMTKNSHEPIPT